MGGARLAWRDLAGHTRVAPGYSCQPVRDQGGAKERAQYCPLVQANLKDAVQHILWGQTSSQPQGRRETVLIPWTRPGAARDVGTRVTYTQL